MNIKSLFLSVIVGIALNLNSQVSAANNTNTQIAFKNNSENALEIIHVPNLSFGEHTYGSNNLVVEKSENPFIQVKDSSGTYNGWTLTAKSDGFYTNNQLNKEFKLTFKRPTIIPHTNNSAKNAPVFNGEEVTITDTPTEIMNAESNQGIGHWLANFYENNSDNKIQLYIPDSAYAGSYSASLLWELNAGPRVN